MKSRILIFSFLLMCPGLHAQGIISIPPQTFPDSLGPIEMDFRKDVIPHQAAEGEEEYVENWETLTKDSSYMVLKNVETAQFAYRYKDSFIIIDLPFGSVYVDTLMDFDGDGRREELVLSGSNSLYGSGGGSTEGYMMMIKTVDPPIQLFKVMNNCGEEDFGRPGSDGETREGYTRDLARKITIKKNKIIIRGMPYDQKEDGANCSLTFIPSGVYVFQKERNRFLKIR
jgi:hypothetical protein